ncbi:unnamed protein product [Didymodactylos carnosus]|uniref:Uncharacterized protein n=1 Tax=Didymodactylos carnosus TaxID=1234261 RepID=A0A813V624_9BILA|nr:unnamed protein product [Didymodactylos carnosus]CAF3622895.1 unnamed protein product [Didymodactylos carnosus]CAF4026088.1 unnamed protein product [Didymodactylos carnosus]
MSTVDPKRNRPFRRVLYREDSTDSTIIQDVTPRFDGYLTDSDANSKRQSNIVQMTNASRKLMHREGMKYKPPPTLIKYFTRVKNDPMSKYLKNLQQYNGQIRKTSTSNDYDSKSMP